MKCEKCGLENAQISIDRYGYFKGVLCNDCNKDVMEDYCETYVARDA